MTRRTKEECIEATFDERLRKEGAPWSDRKCPVCDGWVYRLPAVKIRWLKAGPHFVVTLFLGEDIEHLANAGVLRLRKREFEHLVEVFKFAANSPSFEQEFELVIEETDLEDLTG